MPAHISFFRKIHRDLSDLPSSLKRISLAFFLYSLSWGVIIPFFPLFIKSHANSYTEIGFLVGLVPLMTLLVKIPVGDLVDKISKEKVMIFSLLNYLIIGPLYAMTVTVQTMIIARVYHGIMSVGVWIPARAFVRENSPKHLEAESMGLFSASNALSTIAGSLLGAGLLTLIIIAFPAEKNPINYLFYLPAIGAVITILLLKNIPEKQTKTEPLSAAINDVVIKDKLFEKEIIDYVSEGRKGIYITALHFILNFSIGMLMMNLALTASNYNASFMQIGIIYAVFHIPFTMQFIFGDLADHIGKKKILYAGAAITAVFFSMLFLSSNIIYLFVFSLFVALGISMMAPVLEAYITDFGKGKDGEITGIYSSVESAGKLAGPITAGILSDVFRTSAGLNAPFALCTVLFLISIIIIKKL